MPSEAKGRPKDGSSSSTHHLLLKYASLLVLVVQNSALAILLRWARTTGSPSVGAETENAMAAVPSASVAVLAAEWIKGGVALLVLAALHLGGQGASFRARSPHLASSSAAAAAFAYPRDHGQQQHPGTAYTPTSTSSPRFGRRVDYREVRHARGRGARDPRDPAGPLPLLRALGRECFGPGSQWHLCVPPALLYFVQNNLQYLAASLLDPATFQVTYQLKLLTTALFSVLLLRRRLTRGKWACLMLLTLGVALVQVPVPGEGRASSPSPSGWRHFEGLLTVLLACVLSGLAGVW
jgi:hypothetical protein